MLTIVTKPVEFFRPDPANPRKAFDDNDLKLLGASLRKKQLVPLIARKNGLIVDGERRWRAARLASLTSLDAVLVEDTATDAEAREIQLVTALHRADLRPWEVFCGFVDWLKLHPGKNGKDLAAAVDRSEAAVSMTLSLSRCIKRVQEAAEAGQIGLKDWYTLSQMPQDQQEAALMARLRGESVAAAKRAARGINGVRTAKVKCAMPSGVTVTLVGNGEGLTLGEMIEELTQLVKEMKRADEQGLDSKTFAAVMRDRARNK